MLQNKKLIIIDLEATCWLGRPPKGQQNEIIEIGVAVIDLEKLSIIESDGIFVKPKFSEISRFCTELTSIRYQDVKNAPYLEEACEVLRQKYESKSYPWASFGEYDLQQMKKECGSKQVIYPMHEKHWNIKQSTKPFFKTQQPLGMVTSLQALQLDLIGTHHRGKDDAYNIARIAIEMIKSGWNKF